MTNELLGTEGKDYAQRLRTLESVWWKRLLDVQRPYRRHLQSLDLGFVLDIGCGLGRNLCHLNGNGVGVDHNPDSIREARSRGLRAFLPPEFSNSEYAAHGRFDTILCAHVVEHMHRNEAQALLAPYVPFLRDGGQLVLITPQEAGFRSDPTHVEFCDLSALAQVAIALGLRTDRAYSFPFPRVMGHLFKYNEFVSIARK
jgi:2-polyprenyl-3-methyl-5-hydroxy-6-metoxy-1,4-benzoquinol methylase